MTLKLKFESFIQSLFVHKMYKRTLKSKTEEAEQQFRPVVAEFNQQFRPAIAVIKMPLYIRLAWWFVLLCGGVLVAAIIDSCLSYFTDYTISAGLWLVYRLVYAFWKYIESWLVFIKDLFVAFVSHTAGKLNLA